MENTEDLRYPIGNFIPPAQILKTDIKVWRIEIERLPRQLKQAVSTLNDNQLDTPYRQDGWTLRQVVHHLADSHINAFCRIKLTLTEDNPTIKPYEEGLWASLADASQADIKSSIKILEGLHKRMGLLIKSMSKTDYKRTFFHPGLGKNQTIGEMLAMYAWHGKHHLAHIENLKRRMNWK